VLVKRKRNGEVDFVIRAERAKVIDEKERLGLLFEDVVIYSDGVIAEWATYFYCIEGKEAAD